MELFSWMNKSSLFARLTFLGIYFDKKLNFQLRTGKIIQKLSKQCGIVHKFRETLNTLQLNAYMKAFVSPVVQYGLLLYRLGKKAMLQQSLVVQKELVRITLRLRYRSSVLGKSKDCQVYTLF